MFKNIEFVKEIIEKFWLKYSEANVPECCRITPTPYNMVSPSISLIEREGDFFKSK
jgi:hypothetical protein